MTTRKVPPDEIVIADFNAGMSSMQMSAKYDVTKVNVEVHLQRLGLRRNKPIATVPNDAQIAEHLQAGMTVAQIARLYGCTVTPIHARLKSRKVEEAKAPPPAPVTRLAPVPSPSKHINALGISVPRITAIHGPYRDTA